MPRDRFEVVPVSNDKSLGPIHYLIWDSQNMRHVFQHVHLSEDNAADVARELNQIVAGQI